ncbi:hypothetical protein AFLA_013024 [Aspergillus flavus NRRL3357]|nr:hypothetical protein AFLA_013024 [Aspergillus flavus NRRL3357]
MILVDNSQHQWRLVLWSTPSSPFEHKSVNTMNSTLLSAPPETYWGQFEEISKYNTHLNVLERLWTAWYAWMQNDVLATGIMSFVMHEIVYFGRSLPWIFIDSLGLLKGYKIQSNKIPSLREQWDCAKFVLLSHFTVELPQIWCVSFWMLCFDI